jgi:pimeloyl-ACP methyl ester carboxylesterase
MNGAKIHGKAPLSVAVIHGGPGAAGEMAPVARELAKDGGILEPIQTATSIKEQVEELKETLENACAIPVTLIGFSWGAWLAFILAAEHPQLVKKLILIGSGPFEEKYAAQIQETRLNRLDEREKGELEALYDTLNDPTAKDKDTAFARFGALFSKADSYDPIDDEFEDVDFRMDIFQRIWPEAAEMRRSGRLLSLGEQNKCPVVAIHGDYDPHPAEGVQEPLYKNLKNFHLIILKNCGHKPWIEREAKVEFYKILKTEVFG